MEPNAQLLMLALEKKWSGTPLNKLINQVPLYVPSCKTSGETMNPTKNGRAHMFSPCNLTQSILKQELKS